LERPHPGVGFDDGMIKRHVLERRHRTSSPSACKHRRSGAASSTTSNHAPIDRRACDASAGDGAGCRNVVRHPLLRAGTSYDYVRPYAMRETWQRVPFDRDVHRPGAGRSAWPGDDHSWLLPVVGFESGHATRPRRLTRRPVCRYRIGK
jgi:hypothetical protein